MLRSHGTIIIIIIANDDDDDEDKKNIIIIIIIHYDDRFCEERRGVSERVRPGTVPGRETKARGKRTQRTDGTHRRLSRVDDGNNNNNG